MTRCARSCPEFAEDTARKALEFRFSELRADAPEFKPAAADEAGELFCFNTEDGPKEQWSSEQGGKRCQSG